MMAEKINALNQLKQPTTHRKLRSFLGMANYYRRFIPNFATIAVPLYRLLKKGVKFVWDEECQEAFSALIQGINEDAVLAFPDFRKQFHLTTDASTKGMGAVLSQADENDIQRPVSFISRKFTGAETRYSTTEQECLAIVWAITTLRHYLVATEFVIYCDHRPLVWMQNNKTDSSRVFRWANKLQEYKFTIKYKPGRENYVADELSRNFGTEEVMKGISTAADANDEEGGSGNDTLFMGQCNNVDVIDNPSSDTDSDDEELVDRKPGCRVEQVTDEGRIRDIIWEMHSSRWAGHRGRNATEAAVRFSYSFPNMRQRIKSFIEQCKTCQKHKHPRVNRSLPMILTTTSTAPNELIAFDVVGPFKYPNNKKYYGLTIQDDFSKFTQFCALEDCTAASIAKQLCSRWINIFSCPLYLKSDNGKNLTGEVLSEVAKYFGITQITTSLGYPQANGAVEKAHLRLAEFIRMTDEELEEDMDWETKMSLASFAFNTTVHATTGYSPHHLMFGRPPRVVTSIPTKHPFPTMDSYISDLQRVQNELWTRAKDRTLSSKVKTVNRDAVSKRRKIEEYYVGQKVYIRAETLRGKANRTEAPWMGPFEVVEVTEQCVIVKKRNRISRINKAHCKPFIE